MKVKDHIALEITQQITREVFAQPPLQFKADASGAPIGLDRKARTDDEILVCAERAIRLTQQALLSLQQP